MVSFSDTQCASYANCHTRVPNVAYLSAHIKCRAVLIVTDSADFVPGPQLQNGMEYELTVKSSPHNVSEFVKIVRIPWVFKYILCESYANTFIQ